VASPQALGTSYIFISPTVIHHSATVQGPAIVTLWNHTLPARHDRRWGGRQLKQLSGCQDILEGALRIWRPQCRTPNERILCAWGFPSPCHLFEYSLLYSKLLMV